MEFLITIDVEGHSISLNREEPNTIRQIHNDALPKLLNILSKRT
jgi:hypothetical protein